MKKIVIMACCIAIMIAVAISGTIAYFTDTDEDLNVFTVGKVVIELIEQQRDAGGAKLEQFVNDKKLMPMFDPEPDELDSKFGLPTADAFQDKIVQVKNTGESEAYVRVYVGVPAELDNKGALHLVDGGSFNTKSGTDYKYTQASNKIESITIGTETFNFYCFTLNKALPVDTTTGAAIAGVYLDAMVDCDYQSGDYYLGSKKDPTKKLEADLSQPVNIPVYVQAVQTDGFDNPADAFAAAFTEAPWGGSLPSGGGSGEPTPPPQGQPVDTSEENLNKAENKPKFNAVTQKYEISNATQLYSFAMMVNNNIDSFANNSNIKVVLTDNIYLNSTQNRTPIGITKEANGGNINNRFSGEFDGGGKTIYNMNIKSLSDNPVSIGLFGQCRGTIQNLNIANAAIKYTRDDGNANAGFIAASLDESGQIRNCNVTASTMDVTATSHSSNTPVVNIGGIAGSIDSNAAIIQVTGCSVSNCRIKGNSAGQTQAGGIVGGVSLKTNINAGLKLDVCTVSNCRIEAIGDFQTQNGAGGIMAVVGMGGMHIDPNLKLFSMTNCKVENSCGIYGSNTGKTAAIIGLVEISNNSNPTWDCDSTNTFANDTKVYYKDGTGYKEIANCPKCNIS